MQRLAVYSADALQELETALLPRPRRAAKTPPSRAKAKATSPRPLPGQARKIAAKDGSATAAKQRKRAAPRARARSVAPA